MTDCNYDEINEHEHLTPDEIIDYLTDNSDLDSYYNDRPILAEILCRLKFANLMAKVNPKKFKAYRRDFMEQQYRKWVEDLKHLYEDN